MKSNATTVDEYLASLPDDRRKLLEAVRNVIRRSLGRGYEEGMQWGMIGYYVPHDLYPAGYKCDPSKPLPFAALASQKNYCSLYLMCVYADGRLRQRFEQAWRASGKKLNMGKSCVRFTKLDDLALDAISQAIREVPTEKFVKWCESALSKNPKESRRPAKTSLTKPRSSSKRTKPTRKRT